MITGSGILLLDTAVSVIAPCVIMFVHDETSADAVCRLGGGSRI